MKNWFIITSLALYGHLSLAMDSEKNTKVLYHGRSVQTLLPALLWERVDAEIVDIDGKNADAIHAVIVSSEKTYIYGTFNREQLEQAFLKIGSLKNTVSLMIKTGDPMHQKIVDTYDPEVEVINFNETSFLEPT